MNYVLEFSRETERIRADTDVAVAVDVENEVFNMIWLMRLWRLRSPKIAVGNLETRES